MDNVFLQQLALVLFFASFIGAVSLKLKLPLVVAYLLAGIMISLLGSFSLSALVVFNFLPNLGIAFVLFLIGMELDLREVKSLGVPIVAATLGQIIISTFAGFAIAGALGFSQTEAVYLGLGLSFSSTIVVIKLLLEKRDLTSLYGKLSLGILLLEDLVAILVLMAISLNHSFLNLGLQSSLPIAAFLIKAALLFILTFVLSKHVLRGIFDAVAGSVELLFLTAITWCFVFTSLAILAGFSVVIGAFLAGVALASSPYHLQIQGKIKPLRDFFVALFFIYLGSQARISDILTHPVAILSFTTYAILIKPLIVMLILGTFGFRKHTLFKTALNLSQISEFSLVILLLGVETNLVSQSVLSVMAAAAVLSIIGSSITITYSRQLYALLLPFLSFFEHKSKTFFLEEKLDRDFEDHVVLIGASRVGGPLVEYLKSSKIPFIVMDFDPHIVQDLKKEGINTVYGDVSDPEVLDSLGLEKAKLIISTANDLSDNGVFLEECKRRKVGAKIVIRVPQEYEAKQLKHLGADYVVSPEEVFGELLVAKLKTSWPNPKFDGLD